MYTGGSLRGALEDTVVELENRTGHGEVWNAHAITTLAQPMPQGTVGLEWPFRAVPNEGQG